MQEDSMICIDKLHTKEAMAVEAKIKAADGFCEVGGSKCMCLAFIGQEGALNCPAGLYAKTERK